MAPHYIWDLAVAALALGWFGLSTAHAAEPGKVRVEVTRAVDAETRRPDLRKVEARIIELSNALRQENQRQPLSPNRELTKSAVGFADFMATNDKYGHTADDRQPAERAEAAGYEYCIIEENIAWLFNSTGFSTEELASKFFDGWKNSPEHRANLLNPYIDQIGVAVGYSERSGKYYGVQEFGRPKSEQIVFEIANRSAEKVAYEIDGEKFDLEPRYSRKHSRCVPPRLTFTTPLPGFGSKPVLVRTGEQLVISPGEKGLQLTKITAPEANKAQGTETNTPKPATSSPAIKPPATQPATASPATSRPTTGRPANGPAPVKRPNSAPAPARR